VFADLPDEAEERVFLHPVIVVDHYRPVRCGGIEVEEFFKLFLQALLVMAQGLLIKQVSLL